MSPKDDLAGLAAREAVRDQPSPAPARVPGAFPRADKIESAMDWTISYDLCDRISTATDDTADPVSMEQVEAVCMALEDMGLGPAPKPVKITSDPATWPPPGMHLVWWPMYQGPLGWFRAIFRCDRRVTAWQICEMGHHWLTDPADWPTHWLPFPPPPEED